jgi:dihydrofolate reductase
MTNISIIVAITDNFGIGKDNKLLCHIPGDLPRFRKITSGHTVIMGKNTFLSLPGGALKNRKNIVISDKPQDFFEGCITVFSLEDALQHCDPDKENFVIGGASIYRQFLPYAFKLYLTIIHKNFEADTFFPIFDKEEWKEMSRELPEDSGKADFDFEYVVLQRKNLL